MHCFDRPQPNQKVYSIRRTAPSGWGNEHSEINHPSGVDRGIDWNTQADQATKSIKTTGTLERQWWFWEAGTSLQGFEDYDKGWPLLLVSVPAGRHDVPVADRHVIWDRRPESRDHSVVHLHRTQHFNAIFGMHARKSSV